MNTNQANPQSFSPQSHQPEEASSDLQNQNQAPLPTESATSTTPSPDTTASPQPQPAPDPQPAQHPVTVAAQSKAPAPDDEPEPEPETLLLSWSAPEFVSTSKPKGWYVLIYGFFGVLIILAIIFQQWFSIPLSIVMAITITVFANRKPKNQVYSISNYGIHIGDKQQEFDHFKAFFVSDDYGQKVFDFVPVKRFEPLVSVPVNADNLDAATELISRILPETTPRVDPIDKLFKYLRF